MLLRKVGVIGERCGFFIGPRSPSVWHAHHAVEVSVCLAGAVCLECEQGPTIASADGFVVAADVRHRVTESRGSMLIAYLDPESVDLASRACAWAVPPVAGVAIRRRVGPWLEAGAPASGAQACTEAWLQALELQSQPPAPFDPRVEHARARLGDPQARIQVTELSRELGLSRGRLAQLFAQEVGVPMRTWRKWARLRVALIAAFAGRELSEAAHAAGFADAAHFTRTCREMLGLPPSRFTRLDRLLVLTASPPDP